MKFNQEEDDDEEENIPEEESTASFLINDSESESDYRSTLDIPWSEGSTLFEEKVKKKKHGYFKHIFILFSI